MSDRPDIDAYLSGATKEARKDALFTEMVEALEWFCARVEAGEVRSRETYARFKAILTKVAGETSQ